ncbi:hypothetical protein SR1949_13060 [Sphaerospermopsis reniformis]|uniref:Uncharacterized protein n=1 Tax=Sphaerospermopsis reniformis TaxID=531300 RepID=A0A480A226_9CYAN|nr:hypothetical protein SR1949_13060 [Sphaerospermopsis reniformis]
MTFFPFESLPATWVITLLTHLFPKLHPSVHEVQRSYRSSP